MSVPHVIFSGGKSICIHCGMSYDMRMRSAQPTKLFLERSSTFVEQHRDCAPCYEFITPSSQIPIKERALLWANEESMLFVAYNLMVYLLYGAYGKVLRDAKIKHLPEPVTKAECLSLYSLFLYIPEFNKRKVEIQALSPLWRTFMASWDQVCAFIEKKDLDGLGVFMGTLYRHVHIFEEGDKLIYAPPTKKNEVMPRRAVFEYYINREPYWSRARITLDTTGRSIIVPIESLSYA